MPGIPGLANIRAGVEGYSFWRSLLSLAIAQYQTLGVYDFMAAPGKDV